MHSGIVRASLGPFVSRQLPELYQPPRSNLITPSCIQKKGEHCGLVGHSFMQSTHIYWASTRFQALVSNRGLRGKVHIDPGPWHAQPGRAAGHMSRHSQYSVVSVLEVAQVTEGAQRRDPGPAVGSKEGFLGDVSLEDF